MTLSGKSDRSDASKAARDARQEREARSAAKRPWQFPLIVGIAVVALVSVIVAVTVFGAGS